MGPAACSLRLGGRLLDAPAATVRQSWLLAEHVEVSEKSDTSASCTDVRSGWSTAGQVRYRCSEAQDR